MANEVQAVRVVNRVIHANRDWFAMMDSAADADASFDAGEFGGGHGVDQAMSDRLASVVAQVAQRFGLTFSQLDHAIHEAEWIQLERAIEALRAKRSAKQ
jgi:hypothetical protein